MLASRHSRYDRIRANYVKPESVLGGAENRRVKPKMVQTLLLLFDHAKTDRWLKGGERVAYRY